MFSKLHSLKDQLFILKPQDLNSVREELIRIYVSAYKGLEEYAYSSRSDIKRYLKWLYNADKNGILIAKIEDEIVGFTFFCHKWWDKVYGEIGEIHEIAVSHEHKGKGIGKALIQEAINSLKKHNSIFGLWVGEKNEVAKRLYKKLGFIEEGRVGKWIRMIKKL